MCLSYCTLLQLNMEVSQIKQDFLLNRMFPPPVEKCSPSSSEKSHRSNQFHARDVTVWHFVGHVGFCLTEHSQNFLSCSSGTGLSNHDHTNTKPDLSLPLQSVASETVTASLRSSEPPHLFLRSRRERVM